VRPHSLSGRLALMLLMALLVALALMGAAFLRDREARAGERETSQAAERIALALDFIGTGQVNLPLDAAGLRVQLDAPPADAPRDGPPPSDPRFAALLRPRLAGAELISAHTEPGYAARVRLPGGERILVQIVHTPPAHGAPPPPFVAFAGLAVSLAAALLCATLWITRPLRRVAQAADRIDTRGLTARLDESGPSEVSAVLRAFNRMRDRIDEQTTDRVRVLQGVSHDLKTPLTRLRFRVDDLADGTLRDSISRDIDAMQAMVGAALDYMRTLDDAQPVERVDLTMLLQDVCDNANKAGGRASLQQQAPLVVAARPAALQRAFANLIDNAIRYGGWAEVTIEAGGADIVVRVRDGGPGLSERDMARAFEPYYRGSAAGDASRGNGLGLAIARDSFIRHGGSIELKNCAGGGLEVSVRLPEVAAASSKTGRRVLDTVNARQ
jgi:two-component system, OmpR family, sensor kinase